MAEGGTQKLSQQPMNSEAVMDIFCDVCLDDGAKLVADGYCVTCSDYLCSDCFRGHRKNRMSKSHALQDKATMPREKAMVVVMTRSGSKDECTEQCEQHPGRIAEYYCHDHSQQGCSVCMTINHRKCDNVVNIPDSALGLIESETYKEVGEDIARLKTRCEQCDNGSEENASQNAKCSVNPVKKVEDLQTAMNQLFETVLDSVRKETDAIQSNDQQRKATVDVTLRNVLSDAERLVTDMDVLKTAGLHCQLYMKMVQTSDELKRLNSSLDEAESMNTVTEVAFSPSSECERIINGSVPIGKLCSISMPTSKQPLRKVPGNITVEHVRDVSVQTYRDREKSMITGVAALPDNKLVIADRRNNKVKLVDVLLSKVTAELETPDPWDITLVSNTQAAVTLPGQESIMLVEISAELKKQNTIEVGGDCRGIASTDGKLIVTLVSPHSSIVIMNLDGVIERKVAVNGVRWLSHVAFAPDSGHIFLSDYAYNSEGPVVRLESDETQKEIYKSSDLKGLRGLDTMGTTGTLLVAGLYSDTILLLTQDGGRIRALVEDVPRPCGLCYCQETKRLYVGSFSDENVRVYQLS